MALLSGLDIRQSKLPSNSLLSVAQIISVTDLSTRWLKGPAGSHLIGRQGSVLCLAVPWLYLWLLWASYPHMCLSWFLQPRDSFVMYILLQVACNPLWLEVKVDIGKEGKWIMEFPLCLTVLCNRILEVWIWWGISFSKPLCADRALIDAFRTSRLEHMFRDGSDSKATG